MEHNQKNNPLSKTSLSWVPTLYYAEGLPYVVVMTVAVVMYKNLGVSNTDIALYTSWLYLPWVIKPIWSPIVDIFKTKRWWIVTMQLLIGGALAGVAFTIPTTDFFQYTLAFFWILAFSSATHDIAADGFYMLGLTKHEQAFFVGIRSTFYRLAMITGQGLLVILSGYLHKKTGDISLSWMLTFGVLVVFFLVFFVYHLFVLPRPKEDTEREVLSFDEAVSQFVQTFVLFFKKKNMGYALAFLMLYRLGEAQLVKMASPFLLDEKLKGGLALTNEEVGITYGTVGIIALTLGGILGGLVASQQGLKYWLYSMAVAINLPNAVYIFLAIFQPDSLWLINAGIAVEQFGYGFGFTAYMLYMIYISEGEHRTAHFALTTAFMALGMMLPGMFSGWLQEQLGYQNFFIWVLCCALPIFFILPKLKISEEFGRK